MNRFSVFIVRFRPLGSGGKALGPGATASSGIRPPPAAAPSRPIPVKNVVAPAAKPPTTGTSQKRMI